MTDTTDLQVGDIAPEFTTLDSNGTSISLSDFISKGLEVILYFYPKDNTLVAQYKPVISETIWKDYHPMIWLFLE